MKISHNLDTRAIGIHEDNAFIFIIHIVLSVLFELGSVVIVFFKSDYDIVECGFKNSFAKIDHLSILWVILAIFIPAIFCNKETKNSGSYAFWYVSNPARLVFFF